MASKTPPNGRGRLTNPVRPMKMTPPKRGIGKDSGFIGDPAPRKPKPRKNVNPKPMGETVPRRVGTNAVVKPYKAGPRKIMDTGSLTLNRYKKGSDVLVKQMKKGK